MSYSIRRSLLLCAAVLVVLCVVSIPALAGVECATPETSSSMPWWGWPIALFLLTFVMGVVAPVAGVGGGVLFVPIVSGFFPFHLDFVRACGLLAALSGSLSASPRLLRSNLASLRLAFPVALIASSSAIVGALIGLALPVATVQTTLGVSILAICILMLTARNSEFPDVKKPDWFSDLFHIHGIYTEGSTGQKVAWQVHRTPLGLLLFVFIGLLAGMLGLGGGWANVPVLNLVMGAPLKVSVATSGILVAITSPAAAWVYIGRGCAIPLLVVPCVVGMMLGAKIGARLLRTAPPTIIRWFVIGILALAGLKSLTKGLGWAFIF